MRYVIYPIVALSLILAVSCEPEDNGKNNEKLPEISAVDLGLSVKWADKNLWAKFPAQHGKYYAWGEVEPKETYSWDNYKWGNSPSTLSKYCLKASNGTVDGKSVLEASDDVASVLLGGKWRMPTAAEWEELRTSCTWTKETVDGVFGYRISGNDTSIFIPAAGGYDGDQLMKESYGFYWSSTLYETKSNFVNILYFLTGSTSMTQAYRYYGLPVRAVLAE